MRALIIALLLLPLIWHMPIGPDALLYHFPAQEWIRSGKSLFGMAQVNSRFGFDSIEETIAVFVGGRIAQWGYFTFLLWFLSRSPFGAVTLLGLIMNPLYLVIGQSSTDTPAGIMFAVAFLYSLEGNKNFLWPGVFSFMLKPMNGLIFLWTLSARITPRQWIFPTLAAAVWCAHGVIISGCMVYPLSFTCLPVSWVVTTAANDAQWVMAWARDPTAGLASLNGWNWIGDWWWPHYRAFLLFGLAAAVVCITLYRIYGHDHTVRQVRPLFFILFCLVVWFMVSPSPRYATGFFMVIPAVASLALWGKREFPSWIKCLPYICALRLGFI